jgi:hypothetical protein
MDAHEFLLLVLLGLAALAVDLLYSPQIDRFVTRLTWPERWTVQPVCINVELTVGCVPLTDILSDDGGQPPPDAVPRR